MDKFIKYAPIATAIAWFICMIIAIFKPTDYRIEFIIAAAVLTIYNLIRWSDKNDRKTDRSDNEPRQESEPNNNDQ